MRSKLPKIARCSMTGRLREPSSATYSAPSRSGSTKSTCSVPHCQSRPMASRSTNSSLGP